MAKREASSPFESRTVRKPFRCFGHSGWTLRASSLLLRLDKEALGQRQFTLGLLGEYFFEEFQSTTVIRLAQPEHGFLAHHRVLIVSCDLNQ